MMIECVDIVSFLRGVCLWLMVYKSLFIHSIVCYLRHRRNLQGTTKGTTMEGHAHFSLKILSMLDDARGWMNVSD